MTKIVVYQVLHLLGVLMVFSAYGALIARVWTGSTAVGLRKFGAILSGVGLLLILVSGFGMQAVFNYGWPLWILVKFAVWLSLGAMIVMINRKALPGTGLYAVTILLGLVAVAMVYVKPS